MSYNPLLGVMHKTPILTQRLMAYPAVFCGRQDIDKGDKILLPTSLLHKTLNMKLKVMTFCVQNTDLNRQTYCGVLQFVADQGLCFLPNWMFNMLALYEGQKVNITLINDMKLASLVKIRPHKTQFIDLPNPRALLQNQLRNFTCLHQGDTITIRLPTKKTYDIDIIKLQPYNDYKACCIVNTNMIVQFQAPLDYVQPQKPKPIVKDPTKPKNVFDSQNCSRFDGKDTASIRKRSQILQMENRKQQQYDPRKNRLPKGIRIKDKAFTGKGSKFT